MEPFLRTLVPNAGFPAGEFNRRRIFRINRGKNRKAEAPDSHHNPSAVRLSSLRWKIRDIPSPPCGGSGFIGTDFIFFITIAPPPGAVKKSAVLDEGEGKQRGKAFGAAQSGLGCDF